MIHLKVKTSDERQVDREGLIQAAQTVLDTLNQNEGLELSIILTNNKQLRLFNQRFRGIDEPTDVLAFPMNQVDPDSGKLYLGDILISIEQAKAQAEKHKNTLNQELQLLVVHGILHLLGYDHIDPTGKAKMWDIQGKILQRIAPSIRLPE